MSSDRRNLAEEFGDQDPRGRPIAFIGLDPPAHDRMRRVAMRRFGPPYAPGRVDGMRDELTDGHHRAHRRPRRAEPQADLVEDVAYPFPVTVICRLLGVPREDEPKFHVWADHDRGRRYGRTRTTWPSGSAGATTRRPRSAGTWPGSPRRAAASLGDDLLSGLVATEGEDEPLTPVDVIATATLLLIAGHETTVNLITNGMLTLLRQPGLLARMRREPELVIGTVEELLRYEPPVHFPSRVSPSTTSPSAT